MTHFQLLDAVAAPQPPSFLELWEPVGPVSFAAGEDADAVPVWSVNVSAQPAMALEQLNGGLNRLTQTNAALSGAQARLDSFVANMAHAGPVSFSAEAVALPAPEQELLASLEILQAGRSTGVVSFGGLTAEPDLADDRDKFTQSLERLIHSLAYFVFVETQMEGRYLCRTTLSWAAEARTTARANLTPEQWAVHRQTLELAVQSRAALMHTVTLAVQSALKISAVLALPGGPLLALPSAWKFFTHVLSELEAKPV